MLTHSTYFQTSPFYPNIETGNTEKRASLNNPGGAEPTSTNELIPPVIYVGGAHRKAFNRVERLQNFTSMDSNKIFDIAQTAFLFSWVSNFSDAAKGDATTLADYVYCCLNGTDKNHPNPFHHLRTPGLIKNYNKNLIGQDWSLVWGPGVFDIDHKHKADNTAYVVYSASLKTYIIAIAGTNGRSILDWLKEDLSVGKKSCVDWNSFDPCGDAEPKKQDAHEDIAQISHGTAYGVWALMQKIKISKYAQDKETKLIDFLKSIKDKSKSTKLIFTGHSLGGALSPTLARWVKENLKFENVAAMPTAGPTPGNATYQKKWDTLFARTEVKSPNDENTVRQWNKNIWCTKDVVPHAWQYIYSKDAKKNGKYYFFDPDFINIVLATKFNSKLGIIESKNKLGINLFQKGLATIISLAQIRGREAFMAQTAVPDDGFEPKWPIHHMGKDHSEEALPQPPKSFVFGDGGYEKLKKYLGTIHVWGYGTGAFGIPFEFFKLLYPHAQQTKRETL